MVTALPNEVGAKNYTEMQTDTLAREYFEKHFVFDTVCVSIVISGGKKRD